MEVLETVQAPTCECHQPGWCSRYKRRMIGKLWRICQGTSGHGAEYEQKHRDLFALWAIGETQQQEAPAELLCPYASRKGLRNEDGTPKTRECCEPG